MIGKINGKSINPVDEYIGSDRKTKQDTAMMLNGFIEREYNNCLILTYGMC